MINVGLFVGAVDNDVVQVYNDGAPAQAAQHVVHEFRILAVPLLPPSVDQGFVLAYCKSYVLGRWVISGPPFHKKKHATAPISIRCGVDAVSSEDGVGLRGFHLRVAVYF